MLSYYNVIAIIKVWTKRSYLNYYLQYIVHASADNQSLKWSESKVKKTHVGRSDGDIL